MKSASSMPWFLGMGLVVTACSIQIGNAPPPSAPAARPAQVAAVAPAPPPRAPTPAPAPAPMPAPPPRAAGFAAQPSQGSPPPMQTRTAGATTPTRPLVGARMVSHLTVMPASTDKLDLDAIQRIAKNAPKRCGLREMAPNVWVRVDCTPYQPVRSATHLVFSARKVKLLSHGLLLVTPKVGGAAPPPTRSSGGNDTRTADDSTPDTVDHRQDGTEGPIKNQGAVGSCTAFSLSTVMDNAIRRQNKQDVVSPLHLWSHYGQPSMGSAADNNLNKPITLYETWPYSPREACELAKDSSEECGSAYGVRPGTASNDARLQRELSAADTAGTFQIVQVDRIETSPVNVDELTAVLASGADLWIAMGIDSDKWTSSAMVNNVIQDWSNVDGGHAIALAGFRRTPSGRQFLIHNSWGPTWGDGGFAWISEAMVKRHLDFAYKVKVLDPNAAPPAAQTDDDCGDTELVDAGTGNCASMCWDDSRRTNGNCATPNPNDNGGGDDSTGAHAPAAPPAPARRGPITIPKR